MGFRFYSAATRDDWLAVFNHVADGSKLVFYRMGNYDEPSIPQFRLEEIPDLGISKTGILVLEDSYFVLLEHEKLAVETFETDDGKSKFTIDPYPSYGAFVFRPSGLFDNRLFITGEIASLFKSEGAVTVAKRVAGYARRNWSHVNHFWIGPECSRLYGESYTFTVDHRYAGRGKP